MSGPAFTGATLRRDGSVWQLVSLGAGGRGRAHIGHGVGGAISASAAMVRDDSAMAFVRPRAKRHGLRLTIEGALSPAQRSGAEAWRIDDAKRVRLEDSGITPCPPSVAWPGPAAGSAGLRSALQIEARSGAYVTAAGATVPLYYDAVPPLCAASSVFGFVERLEACAAGCDAVVAPAYGGIPLAVAAALTFGLPCLILDLSVADTEGDARLAGAWAPQAALLVDDFTSVGSTFARCLARLEARGGAVRRMASAAALRQGVQVGAFRVEAALVPSLSQPVPAESSR